MELKTFIGDLFGFNQEIDNWRSQLKVCESNCLNSKANLVKAENKIVKWKKDIVTIEDLYEALFNDKKDTLGWLTEKDTKINVIYQVTEKDKVYNVDIHNFLCEYDSTIPKVKGIKSDTIALNVLKWVRANVKYERDINFYKHNEFWAKAYMTLKNKKGDCEDGAILIWNMLLANGVPWQRVRLCCGSVNGGGHAYITYCRETDNEWVVLDWCYYYTSKLIKDRPTHKEERNYMNKEKNFYVWFSVDKENGYARQKLTEVETERGNFKIK